MLMLRARSTLEFSMSATALTGAAFSADAAGAGTDDFVAAAHTTGDSHEDAAKSDHDAFGMAVTIPAVFRGTGIVRDHVDHLFLAGARQICHRPVHNFFFDLDNFLQRQVRLCAVRRRCFLVTFDEFTSEPPENVIGNAGGVTDVGIFSEPARFESLVRKFFDETLERHAVLERDRCKRPDSVH